MRAVLQKCAAALLLLLIVSALVEPAFAADDALVKIDQVYADLPEMRVYFHLLDKNGDPVNSTLPKDIVLLQYDNEKAAVTAVRNAAADKTQVFFLLDISDSMPTALFESIKTELLRHYQTRSENEQYTLITFGKEVTVCLEGSESAETAEAVIKALRNTDTSTVLYDAVSKVGELTATRSDYARRMVYLFTDGEDWAVGGHTQSETQDVLQQSGIPVYAFGSSTARKQDLDKLSELARASGGAFTSVMANSLSDAVAQTETYVDSGYAADVMLKSNVVNAQSSSVVLQVNGASDSRVISIKNWQADNVAPVITEAWPEDSALHISFSENIIGGIAAQDYTITAGTHTYPVASAMRISDSEVVLQLSVPLYNGEYTIDVANVTDTSAEQNALTESYLLVVDSNPYTAAAFLADNALWIILGLVVCAAVIVVIIVGTHRKRAPEISGNSTGTTAVEAKVSPEKFRIYAAGGKPVHLSICGRNLVRRDIDLCVAGTILIGRSASCDVSIDDAQISRQNTELTYRNDRFFVKNISQTNGTMLNGLMISGERELHSGDMIVLGDTRITVTFS